jgi:inosine/xanthosine triphosphate pyrophosphatase family protein
VHLCNDAVQKKSTNYGKFESGNKVSYQEFQKYLEQGNFTTNFMKKIHPRMKKIGADTIKCVYKKLDPTRKHSTFEIFGYDFMLDY